MGTVSVRWAVRGKQQGQREDYRIIADDSNGRQAEEYSRRVMHLTTGSGKVTPNNPAEALPWCTLVPDSGRLALAITEWPQPAVQDGHGRPVVFTRYFDIALADALASGVSYHDLHATLNAQTQPRPGLTLPLPPPDLARVAANVDHFDFRDLLAIVASLLEGSVVVLKGPPPPDRLDFLDAVAALLPYGVRSSLPVATWSENPISSHQPLRLFFSDVAAPGQKDTLLGQPTKLKATNQVALDYINRVEHMYESGGAAYLVEALWSLRQPLSLADPVAVLDALGVFVGPYAVAQDVLRVTQQGRVSPDPATVNKVLTMFAEKHLPKSRLADWEVLVGVVTATGKAADLEYLPAHMIEHPAIATALAGEIVRRDASVGAAAISSASRQGAQDVLVAALMEAQGAGPVQQATVVQALAQARLEPTPALRGALLGKPGFTALLIIEAARPGGNPAGFISLLANGPDTPPWLAPFITVSTGQAPKPHEIDGVLGKQKPLILLALLAYCIFLHRASLFFYSAGTTSLLDPLAGDDARLRERTVAILGKADLSGDERAVADILLASAGANPPWAGTGLPVNAKEYGATVTRAWPALPKAAAARILGTLVTAVLQAPVTEGSISLAIDLAVGAPQGPGREQALDRIAVAAATNIMVLEAQPQDVLADLLDRPGLRGKAVLLELRAKARAGRPTSELAALAADALAKGSSVQVVLEATQLSTTLWRSPAEVHTLLRWLAAPGRGASPKELETRYELAVGEALKARDGAGSRYKDWLTARHKTEQGWMRLEKHALRGRAGKTGGIGPALDFVRASAVVIAVGVLALVMGAAIGVVLSGLGRGSAATPAPSSSVSPRPPSVGPSPPARPTKAPRPSDSAKPSGSAQPSGSVEPSSPAQPSDSSGGSGNPGGSGGHGGRNGL
jgi:hypothetical protein